jgi:hypothetical protein
VKGLLYQQAYTQSHRLVATPHETNFAPQNTQNTRKKGAFVEVGRVARAHGVRGELRIAPLTDAPKRRFARGKRCAFVLCVWRDTRGLCAQAVV